MAILDSIKRLTAYREAFTKVSKLTFALISPLLSSFQACIHLYLNLLLVVFLFLMFFVFNLETLTLLTILVFFNYFFYVDGSTYPQIPFY